MSSIPQDRDPRKTRSAGSDDLSRPHLCEGLHPLTAHSPATFIKWLICVLWFFTVGSSSEDVLFYVILFYEIVKNFCKFHINTKNSLSLFPCIFVDIEYEKLFMK